MLATRGRTLGLGWLALALVMCAMPAAASDAVQQMVITAHLESATSVRVSSHTLVFDVSGDGQAATASIDYRASARTGSGAEVVFSIEPLRAVEGPGGSADADCLLTLGGGDGAPLSAHEPTMLARWTGSGTRAGRVTFTLRAAAAGTYVVPVRLLLTAP